MLYNRFHTTHFLAGSESAQMRLGRNFYGREHAKHMAKLNAKVIDVQVPEGHTCVAIVQKGSVKINGEAVKAVELVQFDREGSSVTIESESTAQILVLTGEPIGEPVAGQGPFVMNTREEIREAMRDYQAGKMGHLAQ